MKKVFVFIVFSTVLFVAFGQKVVISGQVKDRSNDMALPGANVVIADSYTGTFSSVDGSFSLVTKLSFPIKIVVSYIGYTSDTLILNEAPKAGLQFLLQPATVVSNEIVIRAIKLGGQDIATYSNLTPRSIERINNGTDMPIMLENLPSVTTTSDAGAGIGYSAFRLRGTDQNRINVTINGVPYNDPESHIVYWVDVPDLASSSEEIQVQRGVGTSTNGSASFGGSINVSTHGYKPNPFAMLNFRAGSFGTLGTNAIFGTGLLNNHWIVDGRVSLLHSDGYIDRAYADLQSLQTNIAWYGKKSLLRMMVMHGRETTYQAWEGVPKDSLKTNRTYNPYSYENEIDKYVQNHFHLVLSNQHSLKWSSSATAFLITGNGFYEQYKENKQFSEYLLPDIIIGNDTIRRTDLIRRKMMDNYFYGLVFSANYDNQKRLQVNFGGNANKYSGDHFGKVIWMQYAGNSEINHEFYRNTGIKNDYSAYTKARYAIGKHTSLFADAQMRNVLYDVAGDEDDKRNFKIKKSFFFFNPKAGITHSFNKNSVYAYFGVAGREPNRYMMVDADSGKMPTREILYDYESGYIYAGDNWNLNLNLFYMHYRDQLVQTGEINDIGSAVYVNVPKSYRAGLEAIWDWKINKKLLFSGNTTYSVNKILDLTVFVDDWDTWVQRTEFYKSSDISFSPALTGSANFSYLIHNNLRLTLTGKYVSRQYIDNSSNIERSLDPYKVFNLSAEYIIKPKFVKEIAFRLSLRNIFSEEYETNAWAYRYYYGGQHYVLDGYFPQAYRNWLGSISIKF